MMRSSILALACAAALAAPLTAFANSTAASAASAASAVVIIAAPVFIVGSAGVAASAGAGLASAAVLSVVGETFEASVTAIDTSAANSRAYVEAQDAKARRVRMELPIQTIQKHNIRPGDKVRGEAVPGGGMVVIINGKTVAVSAGTQAPAGLSKHQAL